MVECTGLENRNTRKGIVGSNPTLSARRFCFQKMSKRGIATPKKDMNIIRARLKVAEVLVKELRNGKTHH